MSLSIQKAALLMTIQDAGRFGYQRYGMPESGPMDWWAFRSANRLLGNDPGAPCVEIGFSGAEFRLERRALLAAAGVGYRLFVDERELPLWMTFVGKGGERIWFEKITGGNWVYLAAAGGIQSPVWMGSHSYFTAAGLGQKLAEGDRLSLSGPAVGDVAMAGNTVPGMKRPIYGDEISLRVIPGPHQEQFTSASKKTIWEATYSVSTQSDRMGYRLAGPCLMHSSGADLVSQGMALGEIQVPGEGQPIVMMPDHPTTGGYACIGTVAKVDMPLLSQLEPGRGTLQFQPCAIDEAQSAWAEAIKIVDSAVQFQEDLWLGL